MFPTPLGRSSFSAPAAAAALPGGPGGPGVPAGVCGVPAVPPQDGSSERRWTEDRAALEGERRSRVLGAALML